jgi:hypothetical protein
MILGPAIAPDIPGRQKISDDEAQILSMDTKKTKDTAERKKLKREQRKKAPPKPKRTEPRGSQKKKVKKAVRGQSKR